MTKQILAISLSLLSAASLRAQSEPGPSPAAGDAKPATVHDAAHPAETNAVANAPRSKSTDTAAIIMEKEVRSRCTRLIVLQAFW